MSVFQRLNSATAESTPTKNRKSTAKIKPSTVAVYISVFAVIIAMVSIGYHEPKKSSTVTNAAIISSSQQSDPTPVAVDDVVAVNVAADVAQVANLPIANAVSNMAVSVKSQSEYLQSDSVTTSKPQIIESEKVSRLVTNYTIIEGDTMESLMAKFGISNQTIKWANGMTSDNLTVGNVLKILPVDGVLYTVRSDDTIDSIAEKYKVDKTRLVLFNDLDVSGLESNTKIILPSATLPSDERPGYVAPVVAINYYAGAGAGFGGRTWYIKTGTPGYAGNTYYMGNCTRYAYDRRVELGLSVSSSWGNAVSWASMAAKPVSEGGSGLLVNNIPSVGAVIQNGGGLGHVAIVEEILSNGDLSISEMNAYVSGGGWNIVSGRIVPAGNVSQYQYIH